MSDQDHDLIITIANDTKWIKDTLVEHMKEDAQSIFEIKNISSAAHRRMDKILFGGIMALIVLAITIYFK